MWSVSPARLVMGLYALTSYKYKRQKLMKSRHASRGFKIGSAPKRHKIKGEEINFLRLGAPDLLDLVLVSKLERVFHTFFLFTPTHSH